MKISRAMLLAYAKVVMSPDRIERRKLYGEMYTALNGGLYNLVKKAIRAEFKDPQAISELEARLVPINILKKVTNKMAAVYMESPVRLPVDDSDDDAELLEDYEDTTKINMRQKQANRYLELFKKNLKEVFASDSTKLVYVRNLAPQSYEVFNISNPDKSKPDLVCKIISENQNPKESILHWWSDESFFVTNGDGVVITDEMTDNPNGKNPSKVLPFVYTCKSTDSVDPIMDDAVYRISIAIPIVLTDLFFACKYQCWSMIYTVGVKGKIERNPSSVVALDYSEDSDKPPVINQIKPEVDITQVISMIESTLNLFLSSVGLSGGTLSTGNGDAKDVVSGVSKMLDSAEVIEGKKDQQEEMLIDENETWAMIVSLIPYWRRNQMLNDDLNREFSADFRVSVSFKDPKPMLSETDSINMANAKVKGKWSTWTRELKNMNPDYTDQQIEDLKEEILEEMALFPEIYNPMLAMMESQGDTGDNAKDNKGDQRPVPPKTPKAKNGLRTKVSDKSKQDV